MQKRLDNKTEYETGLTDRPTDRPTEPTPVEKLADDLWIAEKFQSNPDIAGSPQICLYNQIITNAYTKNTTP